MNRKKQASDVIKILSEKFPEPQCALIHENPWQLTVATILSAQCTDKRVNMVTPALFKKLPTPVETAKADIETIEDLIKSTGFYHNKAKNIKACAQMLLEKHKGILPQTIEELTKLPGIGRKTANVVLGNAFGKAEGIVVDTHVSRLSQKLGLTEETDPLKIEKDLMKITPKKHWINISHWLILQGRDKCIARRPQCDSCELSEICPKLNYK